MSALPYKKLLFLIALGLLLLIEAYPSFRENRLRILVSKAYFTSSSTDASVKQLRQVLQAACMESPKPACEPAIWTSNMAAIEAADRIFMEGLDPLHIVKESAVIPATILSPSGPSDANQVTPNSGTLFSEGYFQMRVFLASEVETCWRFSVRALNDDPPPVNLVLWLDNDEMGRLSYTRGDQTWETLSVTSYAGPGVYWFRVWFVNDYLDRDLNVDRNAYIKHIQIAQAEEALCEGE
jgi:hypothetical protein